jgi:hypothetical protein
VAPTLVLAQPSAQQSAAELPKTKANRSYLAVSLEARLI